MTRDGATDLAVDALASWRIVHLIVADVFPPIARTREKILDRYGPEHPVSYLLSCPHCVGVHIGFAVSVLRRMCPKTWRVAAYGLALAALAPLIENVDRRLDAA